jgi:hypothetical protein
LRVLVACAQDLSQDATELALREEAAIHKDIYRTGTIDEYSRSAEKMAAFIKHFGTPEHSPQFEFVLKLDDDNMVDVARVMCTLANTAPSAYLRATILQQPHGACARIGMKLNETHLPLPESSKATERYLWWGHFAQNPIPIQANPGTAYHVDPQQASTVEAHVRCVQKVKAQGGYTTSKLDPFHINKFQRRHHKIYPTYAYGGSHVLSANVLRWWTANPWTLTYDVTWMEDVAFGEPIFWWILQCQH